MFRETRTPVFSRLTQPLPVKAECHIATEIGDEGMLSDNLCLSACDVQLRGIIRNSLPAARITTKFGNFRAGF